MRWAGREVISCAVATWLLSLPACGSEFSGVSDDASDAGSAGSGGTGSGNGGSAGQSTASGSGGSSSEPGGGKGGSGPRAGEGGEAGESSTVMGGDGGNGGHGGDQECEVELLTNGGFDSLNKGWAQLAQPERALIWHQSSDMLMDLGHPPVSPEYAVVLGAVDGDHSSLSQTVSVPADTTVLTLSFYLHIHSNESDDRPYDTLKIYLTSNGGESLPIATYDNLDINDDWVPISFLLEATPYRGKTFSFVILSETDNGAPSTFMLDSFSLTAQRCDP